MERKTESNLIREIGSRRELFVDNYLIDQLNDASLRLHHPQPAEPAVTFDKGEAGFGGYSTVLKDGDVYRMYYRGAWGAEARAVRTTPKSPTTPRVAMG